MTLLTEKSILDLEDQDAETTHVEQIITVLNKISSYRDYECALLCKYQDVAHCQEEQEIRSCKISELLEQVEYFDFKNGIDLGFQGEYLILVIHGQGYTLKTDDTYHLVTMAIKVMPYDENHSFWNVLPILIDEEPTIAHGL